ncbi:MAG: hypothetical protein CR988_07245 [Treponema sp.]|nr:MAG: hypothetical protein CR988_07245 [Treponema sp.]
MITFIILFIPILLWLLFIICRQKIPVNPKLYFSILVFSLLAVFAAVVSETILISVIEKIPTENYAISGSIIPAVIEEIFKITFFYISILTANYLTTQQTKQTDTEYKLKIFAVLFALFFATFENIAYAINDPEQIIIRCMTATVFHAGVAVFYADAIRKKNKRITIVASLILLHITYNLTRLNTLLFFTVHLSILFFCILHIIKLIKKPPCLKEDGS